MKQIMSSFSSISSENHYSTTEFLPKLQNSQNEVLWNGPLLATMTKLEIFGGNEQKQNDC